MTKPASVLVMAGLLSHGRAEPLNTDLAPKDPESENGGHEPGGCPRKWQPE